MGLAEMSAILFGILTVCQYLIAWAAYAEKCFINVKYGLISFIQ